MFNEERALWLYRHYRWLEVNLPPRANAVRPNLIQPTADFFPDRFRGDHASAVALFERVQAHMEMQDWSCRLESDEDSPQDAGAALARSGILGESSRHGAVGTFSADADTGVCVTYTTSLLRDPIGLVATLVHELCHYLLAAVETEPPAGWSELEPLTDLAAVHEGFGIFLCNSAFRFSQWTGVASQGWSTRTQGYLNEAELGFSLAVFCVRNRVDPAIARRHLKPNPGQVFADAPGYVRDLEHAG